MSISREQALDCFASDDLIGIGMEADAVRRTLHPEGVVTYALDRTLDAALLADDLTNLPQHLDAADDTAGLILRNASARGLAWSERLLAALKHQHPNVTVHGFSAPEIAALATAERLEPADVLTRLRAAGLDCLTADRGTLPAALYLDLHRAAHRAGIPSTAEIIFGATESLEDRVAFLEDLRTLQSETHGLLAFSLTAAPAATGRDLDDPTAVEYLKTLAICRMVLDNIENLQANLPQQGLKVLQMGLRFGGNDAGSILAAAQTSEEELRRVIRDAGFKPAQRDTLYRTLFLI
jgi:cyclic dehypoxanthinyl futalosine synthase